MKLPWFVKFDWIGIGYFLFVIGSSLYFLQALDPFMDRTSNNEDDAKINGYYSDGPLDDSGVSGWLSLIASFIFVIESMFYIISWSVCRYYGDLSITLSPWYLDWNHWGNIFFLLGSLGYVYTATIFMTYRKMYHDRMVVLNVLLAVIFVLDSIFYLLALIFSQYSSVRYTYQRAKTFDFPLDLYFIATLLFILGSVMYLVEAVQTYRVDSAADWSSFLAAAIFMLDAPLYLASAFQRRSEYDEVDFTSRKNIFMLEFMHGTEEYPDLMSRGLFSDPYKKDEWGDEGSETSHLSV
jgi:hypothetical protein